LHTRQVLQEGADIIVAQGSEAGGHGGVRATLPLVPAALATDSAELLYAKARAADDFDTAVIHAGEGIDLIHAIEPACAIVARRWRG
jgi:NAD(P)H-dependent flavin oxidoreductase YrpB (nitropropane dioxygenase family)